MNEQELQILELLSQGKLTVEEANELLAPRFLLALPEIGPHGVAVGAGLGPVVGALAGREQGHGSQGESGGNPRPHG